MGETYAHGSSSSSHVVVKPMIGSSVIVLYLHFHQIQVEFKTPLYATHDVYRTFRADAKLSPHAHKFLVANPILTFATSKTANTAFKNTSPRILIPNPAELCSPPKHVPSSFGA